MHIHFESHLVFCYHTLCFRSVMAYFLRFDYWLEVCFSMNSLNTCDSFTEADIEYGSKLYGVKGVGSNGEIDLDSFCHTLIGFTH